MLKPDLYTSLSQAKVIKEAALRSGVSRGVMQACWDAAGEVIKAWATEGHSVALPGLGTMRFGLRSKAVEKVEDVKTGLIESRRIIFTPDVDLKDELKNTAIQITCYDRDGNEVKRVTSTDPGTIEDPENANQNVETPRTATAQVAAQRVATPVATPLATTTVETPAAVATEAMISTRISVLNFRDYDEKGNYKIYRADHRIDCLSNPDCTGSHVLHGTLKRESSAKVEDSSYFQITSSRGRVMTFRRSYQIRLEPWICFCV